jgi:hypothetical protein
VFNKKNNIIMLTKLSFTTVQGVLILSAFGPYIINDLGIRTDHLVIYTSFSYILAKAMLNGSINLINEMKFIIIILIILFLIPFVMLLYNNIYTLKMLASIENYLQPIAVIVIVCYGCSYNNIRIKELIYLFLFLLCLNTAFSVISILYDTDEAMSFFLRTGSTEGAIPVGMSVMSQSRYTGIFNQPFTAGLAYSVGLFGIMYLYSCEKSRFILGLLTIIVFIGGIITVSKVFFPLGVFIALYMLFQYRKINIILILSALFTIVLSVLPLFWDNIYFSRLLAIPSSVNATLELYTSGRLGISNVNLNYAEKIYNDAFLIGYGYATNTYAPDSAYVDYLSQSGVIGVCLYIVLLGYLGFSIFRSRINRNQKILLKGLFYLLILAGVGAPVLTINRVSIIILVLITSLLYQRKVLQNNTSHFNVFLQHT